MKDNKPRTLIGLQNSVMALVDPFHAPALSHSYRRTGEGVDLPVQDGAPALKELFALMSDFSIDFWVQHTMPDETEQLEFIQAMQDQAYRYFIGNEFASINRLGRPGTNRGDFSRPVIQAAARDDQFLGFIYDETEHLQLHPNIYRRCAAEPTTWQWADPTGKTLEQIEQDVTDAVRQCVQEKGCDLFSEHVFPLMYHAFARGGMNLMPKVMKEEYQSLQLASSMGAARQYGRRFGICADLWGPEVGEWFTRKWGFPGHSPEEFENALHMAWHFAPEYLFVENIDALVRYNSSSGFRNTEFGDIFKQFTAEYVPAHGLPYTFRDATHDIAFVRSDDAIFDKNGGFAGHKMYGSLELDITEEISSIFRAWNMLSHGRIPKDGPIMLLPPAKSGKNYFQVTPETIRQLPLEHGVRDVGGRNEHHLFTPMHGVLVYDHYATHKQLAGSKLIVAAGSRMSESCAQAMLACVQSGSTLVSAPWLLPAGYRTSRVLGSGKILVTDQYDESWLLDEIRPLLGNPDIWLQRFGKYTLEIRNENRDKISLDIRVVEQ